MLRNNTFTFLLGIGLFSVAILIALTVGGEMLSFVHIPSFLFVIGVASGLGLASYRGKGMIAYISGCKKHFISAGVVGTVIGTVQMLSTLDDPSQIGKGMAVALLSVFYGIVFYCAADSLVSKLASPSSNFN